MIGCVHRAGGFQGVCLGAMGLARGQETDPRAGGTGFGFADDISVARAAAPERASTWPGGKSRFLSSSIAKFSEYSAIVN